MQGSQLRFLVRSLVIAVLVIGSWASTAFAGTGVLFKASNTGVFGQGFVHPATGGANTGSGVATIDPKAPVPHSFVLPKDAFANKTMTTYYFPQPTSFPVISSMLSATVGFEGGKFGPGLGPGPGKNWCPGFFGPGKGGSCPVQGGTKPGRIQYTGGNGFGGTVRALGVIRSHPKIAVGLGYLTGTINQPVSIEGGAPGSKKTGFGVLKHTTQGFTSPQTVVNIGAPWTTGTVKVSDVFGANASMQTYAGYDNRNAAGTMGNIRLVTPMLSQYESSAVIENYTGVFFLDLQFLPEPRATLLLTAGLISLVGLYCLRVRTQRL